MRDTAHFPATKRERRIRRRLQRRALSLDERTCRRWPASETLGRDGVAAVSRARGAPRLCLADADVPGAHGHLSDKAPR